MLRSPSMRALLALLVVLVPVAGCASSTKQGAIGETRAGVMPMLSELPADASHRDAVLDSSNQVAGPEHRKGMTAKERKAETHAATFAAILGAAFSKTQNVTLGTSTQIDETGSLGGRKRKLAPATSHTDAEPSTDSTSEKATVPWIQLRPTTPSTAP